MADGSLGRLRLIRFLVNETVSKVRPRPLGMEDFKTILLGT